MPEEKFNFADTYYQQGLNNLDDRPTSRASYGLLLNNNAKLYRRWFREMVKLLGVMVIYKRPTKDKHYNLHAEQESNYEDSMLVGCIFEEHIKQDTARKLGWDSELQTDKSLIHVPYDLPGLQVGALFIIPSAFDNTKGRLFKVTRMSAEMIYPASITCELVQEYETTLAKADTELFTNSDFNLLYEG